MSTSTAANPSTHTTVVTVPQAAPQPGAPEPAPSDLPPAFEISLQKMLASFGENRELSMSAVVGAALVRLGNIEQSVAKFAGAAGGSPQQAIAVTVGLEPELHSTVLGKLDALTAAVSSDERELATTRQRLTDNEHRLAQLEEHLGHLRAHCERLASGATEVTEKVAVIQRDHGRFTEELAAFSQRIEPLEHRKKGA